MIGNIHIMGIVNLTPDSFYAASRTEAELALPRMLAMFQEGADVIDLGACSTRPGSPQPSLEEEWRRLEPVLKSLAREMSGNTPPGDSISLRFIPAPPIVSCVPSGLVSNGPLPLPVSGGGHAPGGVFPNISIDTYRAEIVRRVYETIGPFLVNDISAGQMDSQMLETVGRLGLPYVAMHMRGTPETMQSLTDYDDVVKAVIDYFKEFSMKAEDAGVREWILDPGFGFSKTLPQNYELLERLDEVVKAFPERETLIGVSRKSMIYKKLGITPDEAMPATQVVQFAALEKGATWLRVHDVTAAINTARLYSTIYTSSPGAAK